MNLFLFKIRKALYALELLSITREEQKILIKELGEIKQQIDRQIATLQK